MDDQRPLRTEMPPPTSGEVATDYVRGLQRDGRLLLRFAARRPDRPIGPAVPTHQTAAGDQVAAWSVLTAEAAVLAQDQAKLATLVACVDDLSRRAAPASVATIRLSSAYLRIPLEDNEPPPAVATRAATLRRIMEWITVIAVLATGLGVLLLAHVDDGRRAVQQLQEVRRELATIYGELTKLPAGAWTTVAPPPLDGAPRPADLFAAFCTGEDDHRIPLPGRHPSSAQTSGAQAAALCSQWSQAALREELTFQRLAAWNHRTHLLVLGGVVDTACRWIYGPEACSALPAETDDGKMPRHWQRTEIRTAGAISVLTGFVLPLLLGCVGGCAYALRRLDQKLSDWTLEFHDGSHAMLRILLATMLGGLLGVLWTGNEPVQMGGFTLSLAAAAFFVGFSLEVVFTVIEAMVDGVAGKLRAQAGAPARQGG
ncbi:hypothetical protein EJV46_03540 [Roseococcus sp. SYP-B2431]|uniref:hypothetical protein n=1 Tax=Roseococcus sp. SYP-B2431 TaxID=2496640 RepID=UPI00103C5467|nr:hypothetical protein [Roseococcus sp. SYP-B2431]TCH99756.1 hypothetical protein EJV46_03540 [Roseococcus sp. SYP-B2431]